MAKYLISSPSAAMVVPDDEWEAVGRDSHAVIDEERSGICRVLEASVDKTTEMIAAGQWSSLQS